MKKILFYLREYKKESILGPLFKLLEATLELFVPIVMARIIDIGIANEDKSYVLRMSLLLVVFGMVGLAFSVFAQYYAAKASVGFTARLKHELFKHIQSLSFTDIDSLGTNTMITRMTSDMNQVQTGVNLTLRLLLRSPFVVFGAMIMAFTIDFKAALIFVITIPVLSIVVFGIMLWCIPRYKKVQTHVDKILGIIRQNLAGVRVIRAFCKEKDEIQGYVVSNEELTKSQKYVGKISSLMNPITYIIINLAIVSLVWIGAIRVNQGIITQGAVVALYNYMSQILVELVKLANLIINITKSVACGNRIQSVFEIKSSQIDGNMKLNDKRDMSHSMFNKECSKDSYISFNNVCLRYKDASENALDNISFSVNKGEIIGIIGATGSGKSSLVNMIPRFYDVSNGEIIFNGTNIKEYSMEYLRNVIGIVPQRAVLFKGTIRENMCWRDKNASDEDIYKALSVAQAKEIVDAKEGKLDYIIEQGGKNLSGGQRQRLTIARALVKKPDVLILDDSASALDYATDAALRKSIKDMEGILTIFIVSQRATSISHADKIIVLDDGNIVGIGSHEELLNSCENYKEIYESQK